MNARKFSSRMFVFVVAAALLPIAGCETGEPGVRNQAGTVKTRLDHAPDVIVTATKKAVEELKLTLVASKSSSLDGEVIARTAQGDDVTITVERETDKISQIWIRVGTTGDQDMSMVILERIKDNLRPIQRVLP